MLRTGQIIGDMAIKHLIWPLQGFGLMRSRGQWRQSGGVSGRKHGSPEKHTGTEKEVRHFKEGFRGV